MTTEDTYEAVSARSISRAQLDLVRTAMYQLEQMGNIFGGEVTVYDPNHGGIIATIWWDAESELWLADFTPKVEEDS